MIILITYDVNTQTESGKKRLRKIAKKCVNYGQRVQNSVFECSLNPSQYLSLKTELCDIMDKEKDSLRFYNLGKSTQNKIEHFGVKKGYEAEGFLVL